MNTKFSELSLGSAVYIIIATISIAFGVYSAFRIVANYMIFDKYPISNGGMSMMFGGGYYQSEADCLYVRTYYDQNGIGARNPTSQESIAEEQEKGRCLNQVAESRKMSQVNDIAGAVLSLVIGSGLFYAKKFFFKD